MICEDVDVEREGTSRLGSALVFISFLASLSLQKEHRSPENTGLEKIEFHQQFHK